MLGVVLLTCIQDLYRLSKTTVGSIHPSVKREIAETIRAQRRYESGSHQPTNHHRPISSTNKKTSHTHVHISNPPRARSKTTYTTRPKKRKVGGKKKTRQTQCLTRTIRSAISGAEEIPHRTLRNARTVQNGLHISRPAPSRRERKKRGKKRKKKKEKSRRPSDSPRLHYEKEKKKLLTTIRMRHAHTQFSTYRIAQESAERSGDRISLWNSMILTYISLIPHSWEYRANYLFLVYIFLLAMPITDLAPVFPR